MAPGPTKTTSIPAGFHTGETPVKNSRTAPQSIPVSAVPPIIAEQHPVNIRIIPRIEEATVKTIHGKFSVNMETARVRIALGLIETKDYEKQEALLKDHPDLLYELGRLVEIKKKKTVEISAEKWEALKQDLLVQGEPVIALTEAITKQTELFYFAEAFPYRPEIEKATTLKLIQWGSRIRQIEEAVKIADPSLFASSYLGCKTHAEIKLAFKILGEAISGITAAKKCSLVLLAINDVNSIHEDTNGQKPASDITESYIGHMNAFFDKQDKGAVVSGALSVLEQNKNGIASKFALSILQENPLETVRQSAAELAILQSSTASRIRFFLRWIGGSIKIIFDLAAQAIESTSSPDQLIEIIRTLAESGGSAAEKLLEQAIERLDQKTRNTAYNSNQAFMDLYYLLKSSRPLLESPTKIQLIKTAIETSEALWKINSNLKDAREVIRNLYQENPILYRIGLPYLSIGLNDVAEDYVEGELKGIMESGKGAEKIAAILSIIGSILHAETSDKDEGGIKSTREISLFQELKMAKIINPDYRLPYYQALRPVISMFSKAIERKEFARVKKALGEIKKYLTKMQYVQPYTLENVLSAFLAKSIKIMMILKGLKHPE